MHSLTGTNDLYSRYYYYFNPCKYNFQKRNPIKNLVYLYFLDLDINIKTCFQLIITLKSNNNKYKFISNHKLHNNLIQVYPMAIIC